MKKNYIEVIQEEVDREEFTDREKILQELFDWAVGISSYKSRSIALISPRRYGKTAILQRLYNKLFWEQDVVAPFYIEVPKQDMLMGDFSELYFTTFLRQYVGFYLKDPDVSKNEKIDLDELKDLVHQKEKIKKVSTAIEGFQKIKPIQGNWMKMWMYAQKAPSWICDISGTYVAVIIDEFQELDSRIYMDKKYKILKKDITGGFSGVCSKKNAPMLVSGSQVTIVTRKVFGGPLGGRE